MVTKDKNELLSFALRNKEVMMQEEFDIKVSWYFHVLNTLEKLDDHIDTLSSEVYKQRDEFRKDLYGLREKIRVETADVKSIERLEKHVDDLIHRLEIRVTNMENSDSSEQIKSDIEILKTELVNHKTECGNELTIKTKTLKEEITTLLDPLTNKLIRVEVKVAFWGILSGMLGSGIITFILFLLKTKMFGGTP